jgi:hypothetical protein
MIVIDGQETGLRVNNFANLEDLLVKVMEQDYLDNRMVTDVFVNKEAFSEIYPIRPKTSPPPRSRAWRS